MNALKSVTLIFLASILFVETQRREKTEFVPLSFRGDVCDRVCNKRDGWERCEKAQKRNQWEVTCSDTRPNGPPRGPPPPFPPRPGFG